MKALKAKILKKYQDSKDPEVSERFNHVENVAKRALEIIDDHNLDVDKDKAEIAGLVHDYAKFSTLEEYKQIIEENNLDESILETNPKIWHSLLGPYIIKKELNIDDEEILEAVKYHTIGKPNMTTLQEVLYLADFTEASRKNVDNIFNISKRNYKRAIALILEFKINKIKNKGKVHELTIKAMEEYKKYLNGNLDKVKEVIETLDHNLVKDVKIYDASRNTPHYDFVIITTALSQRQMEAAAYYLRDAFSVSSVEKGDFWILVDLKDIIVHIFLEEEREIYGLDKLLKDVPEIELD